MKRNAFKKPVVLVLSGHDPCGGAGIQADIETLSALGCIATSVITCMTAQNTKSFLNCLPQTREDFLKQGNLVLDDISIEACKIGAVGSADIIHAIHEIIMDQAFPVVFDPVIHSTTGHNFVDTGMSSLLCEKILPLVSVITPNYDEAIQLTGEENPQAAADKFFEMGCRNILITDVEPTETQIYNYLYLADGQHQVFQWERLPGNYHGSGCTLASAITANLAKKIEFKSAIEQAQQYTWHCLKNGLQLGKGQLHPNRTFNQIETLNS